MARFSRRQTRIALATAGITVLGGLYLLFLTRAPGLAFVPATQPTILTGPVEGVNIPDSPNYLTIEKIGLQVQFYTGTVATLEKGAWHRFPERGDPAVGGNFILSAHRFNLGLTPQLTKARSPFYNLHKLAPGDTVKIRYQNKDYTYAVTKLYSVKPDATGIEAPSEAAKLTLYSCSLKGEADGRYVVEAVPS